MSGKNPTLINKMDAFFERLLEQTSPSMVQPEGQPSEVKTVPLLDQLKVFEAGTLWIHTRNRLTPEDDTDEFGKLREGYSGSRRRRRSAASGEG